jgi:nanoRNase/pAp phosphatase (c-di-AMP/oligoRNAs hydrolase)
VPNDESDEARARDGLAINAPAEYASDIGSLLAIKSGTYGAVWTYWGAGKYQVSLRSVGDFDVSKIAKYYGGGGHRNAAGFIVDRSKGQKLRLILQDLTYESR